MDSDGLGTKVFIHQQTTIQQQWLNELNELTHRTVLVEWDADISGTRELRSRRPVTTGNAGKMTKTLIGAHGLWPAPVTPSGGRAERLTAAYTDDVTRAAGSQRRSSDRGADGCCGATRMLLWKIKLFNKIYAQRQTFTF